MADRKRVGVRRALVFCGWAFSLGWLAVAAMRLLSPGVPPSQEYQSIYDAMRFRPWFMLCVFSLLVPPALTVLLAKRWSVSIKDWGMRAPNGPIVLVLPAVALSVQLMAIALTVGAGQGEFDLSGTAQVDRLAAGGDVGDAWETRYELSDRFNPALRRAMLGMFAGLIIGAAASPIIEIAWRGLLHTELRWTGFAATSLIVGLIAAAWWVPCVATAPMPGARTVAAMTRLGALAFLGVPLAHLRETTGSIIPPAIFLASWVALLELPLMMVRGASDLQLALMTFTATGLLAGAALLWPPTAIPEEEEETIDA